MTKAAPFTLDLTDRLKSIVDSENFYKIRDLGEEEFFITEILGFPNEFFNSSPSEKMNMSTRNSWSLIFVRNLSVFC